MATTNQTITKAWAKVAEDTDDTFLVTCRTPATVEFALTTADDEPTILRGHLLQPDEAITRIVTGSGYLWMRVEPDSTFTSVRIEVSK